MEKKVIDTICSHTQTVVDREGLERKLKGGRPLRMKLGVDPTRPDLTFGHLVVFRKLRQWQDLGHCATFLIGDFTTTIGDPTGRSALRPVLTREEIKKNAETYLSQAFKILDSSLTEVRYNSEWYDSMSFADLLKLSRESTVAQLLEREDFSQRYHQGTPISLVEFLYPLLQGYDSVMLEADVELGGTDQLFNMLVGRDMQRNRGKEAQTVICMPLLVGLDGQRKMSKSFSNYIALNDSPKEMFGKVMSISDETMWIYYRLLLCKNEEEIFQMQQLHPMAMKKALARQLVEIFHGAAIAANEEAEFERVFSHDQLPEVMTEINVEALAFHGETTLLDVLALSGAFRGKNEIRRLLEQGAVRVDGQRIEDGTYRIKIGNAVVIQVGKRQFFRVN
jgi:tyrosyl-tRNA synthetase